MAASLPSISKVVSSRTFFVRSIENSFRSSFFVCSGPAKGCDVLAQILPPGRVSLNGFFGWPGGGAAAPWMIRAVGHFDFDARQIASLRALELAAGERAEFWVRCS